MAKRLRALNGIDYPDAQKKMTRREVGAWCDDMPAKARARYLASGDVEEVDVAAKPKRGAK